MIPSTYVWKKARLSKVELESRILFQQDGLVAIDKPADLPSSGRDLEDPDCLQYALVTYFGEMVWAVHQLDADTTGVNLFVREPNLVALWKERMAVPMGRKIYLAVVHGSPDFESLRVEEPIGVISEVPHRQLGITPSGKRAVSKVHVLCRGNKCSLVRVELETGRTHQIRIHLASLGHPIVGDDWYGPTLSGTHTRQALHASRMEFAEGVEPRLIESPLPQDMRELIRSLGLLDGHAS
jgi:RluA family pseudouridine synthase